MMADACVHENSGSTDEGVSHARSKPYNCRMTN